MKEDVFMKREIKSLARRALSLALCAVMALSLLPAAFAADLQPAASQNINDQDYPYYDATYATPIQSYLYENQSGGLTRVECIEDALLVEDYDSQFQIQASRSLPLELPRWGGFFAGADYNFVVVGQNNKEENNSTEVVRVIQYSKDWQRLGSASLRGANTTYPFDAGSLRMAEYGGYLYVRTSHTLYRSDDGLNHQCNMMFSVRQSDMTVTDGFYSPTYMDHGYAAHSFNQFVLVDQSQNIVTLDHADAYPRALTLFRHNTKAGQNSFLSGGGARKNLLTYSGAIGDNYTGAGVGGLAETSNGYVVAYDYDGRLSVDKTHFPDRDMYLAFVDKGLSNVKTSKLSSGYNTTTPVLAPTGLSGGYIMWNRKFPGAPFEYGYDNDLYYARYDANGNVGPVQTATASLSDCAPIYWNGKVVWYVTDASAPIFYFLDDSGVTIKAATGMNTTPVIPGQTAYANTQTVLLDGKSVEFQTYALKDSAGGVTNYIKLRDLAYYLNGTRAQFEVDWQPGRGISLTSGFAYTPSGSELSTPFSGNRPYSPGKNQTIVNGSPRAISSIVLTDDNGGDYTYYQLRDMGRNLGFNVSWLNGQVVINTNKPYSDAQ